MHLKFMFETIKLDDHIVAIPVGDHSEKYRGVIKLNETASFIFNLLREDTTVESIVDKMRMEYDASRDLLTKDVYKYIEDFRKKGLII